ncbi:MAG: DUF4147 domain-containing protein, partial [Betaproteobacteria bacterium]|nr:DUF4147 domain-containing protein [Betaproteobacteria bacterium]
MDQRQLLRDMFQAAVQAASPEHTIKNYLPEAPRGRTIVIGCGKAAATMAKAFEDSWEHPLEGLVVTSYGHGVPTQKIKGMEASHPIPDAESIKAAGAIQALVKDLNKEDLVVFLA